jgi:DNA polymerase-3 subunit chi
MPRHHASSSPEPVLGGAPEFRFHFNVENRPDYVARLLRKSRQHGLAAQVVGEPVLLEEISHLLWALPEPSFFTHQRVLAGQSSRAVRHQKAWLTENLADAPMPCPVLILLKVEPVNDFQLLMGFSKIMDVVGLDADERDAGRMRWKHYMAMGLQPQGHDALKGQA